MRIGGRCRRWVGIGVIIPALVAGVAAAEDKYPARPIEVIVPYPPGGGQDIVTRILAEAVEPILGQKLVIANKPGAAGAIGTQGLVQAKPDGYTVESVFIANLVMAPHVLKVAYTPEDYVPVAQLSSLPLVFCVRPDFPARDGKELIAHARQHPEKLTYAGDGVGGGVHLAGERIFQAVGARLRLVPFGGAGESIKALLGGHVDIYGGSIPPALPHAQAGKVRCLLLTSRDRNDQLPGVMGAGDLGVPEAGSVLWRGVIAPKGVPPDRLAILARAFREAVQTERVRAQLRKLGEDVTASPGEEFGRLIRADYEAFAAVVRQLSLGKK